MFAKGFNFQIPQNEENQIFKSEKKMKRFKLCVEFCLLDPGQLELLTYDQNTGEKINKELESQLDHFREEVKNIDLFYTVKIENLLDKKAIFLLIYFSEKFSIQSISTVDPKIEENDFSNERSNCLRILREKLESSKIKSSFYKTLKSFGIDEELHQTIVNLSKELEKRQYQLWLKTFLSHFSKNDKKLN